jgi:hypothetical protein
MVRADQEKVRAALHLARPIVAGAEFGRIRFVNANTPLLDDGATYVGNSVFSVLAQSVP